MVREAFSRAAKRPEGLSGNDFLDAVLRERPDLRGKMAYFSEKGGYGHTVFIGDEVFKGPRYAGMVDGFDLEHQRLLQMEGKGLPIPKVTYVGKETVFYGMTKVHGIVLYDVFKSFSLDEKRVLAQDIVQFIVGMAYALPQKNGQFAMHGDLHDENVLVDPETRKLSAIVDFGLIKYGSKDGLASCIRFGQDDFEQMVAEEYARQSMALVESVRATAPVSRSESATAP